jgi:hypothetical protein
VIIEVGEVIFELSVTIVMIAFDGRFRPRSAISATSPRKVTSEFGMRSRSQLACASCRMRRL